MPRFNVIEGALAEAEGRTNAQRAAVLVHSQFRALVLNSSFPCLGAAGALRRGDYQFGIYGRLGDERNAPELAADLVGFVNDFPRSRGSVAAFVAAFCEPALMTEAQFETSLWEQLRVLNAQDPQRSTYPDGRPIDPRDEELGFLFNDRNFFIVGFHAGASRWARRFAWPVMVFNSLSHQEPLLASGKFDRMRDRIMTRDVELQGFANPALSGPQITQFSGGPPRDDWRCPAIFG